MNDLRRLIDIVIEARLDELHGVNNLSEMTEFEAARHTRLTGWEKAFGLTAGDVMEVRGMIARRSIRLSSRTLDTM
jgi:hypothetical protein